MMSKAKTSFPPTAVFIVILSALSFMLSRCCVASCVSAGVFSFKAARPQLPPTLSQLKGVMIGRTTLRQNESNLSLFSAEHAEALAVRD